MPFNIVNGLEVSPVARTTAEGLEYRDIMADRIQPEKTNLEGQL